MNASTGQKTSLYESIQLYFSLPHTCCQKKIHRSTIQLTLPRCPCCFLWLMANSTPCPCLHKLHHHCRPYTFHIPEWVSPTVCLKPSHCKLRTELCKVIQKMFVCASWSRFLRVAWCFSVCQLWFGRLEPHYQAWKLS